MSYSGMVDRIDEDFVSAIKKEMLKNNFPNEHNVGGFRL